MVGRSYTHREQNEKMFWGYERWWVESFENEEKNNFFKNLSIGIFGAD